MEKANGKKKVPPNKGRTSAGKEEIESSDSLLEEPAVVRTSASHIRPNGNKKDAHGQLKLPKTKKSLMKRLSQSRSAEPPLPNIVVKHKEKYKKLKKKGRIKEANEELKLYQKSFSIAKVNRTFIDALASSAMSREKIKKPRSKLKTGKYGKVFVVQIKEAQEKGKKHKIERILKALDADANMEEQHGFLREMALMNRLEKHPNIISYIGGCIEQEPYFCIMELARGGSLKEYMRLIARKILAAEYEIIPQSDVEDITPEKIHAFQSQCITNVVDGMVYLSSEQIVHCDLGVYNILLDENFICKICDFYYAIDGKVEPKVEDFRVAVESPEIRYKAVESLTDGVYNTQTDVWSFGVLVWELMSLGERPFCDVRDKDVVESVTGGLRLAKPHKCDEKTYQLISSCWSEDPDDRPTFEELSQQFHRKAVHQKKKKKKVAASK